MNKILLFIVAINILPAHAIDIDLVNANNHDISTTIQNLSNHSQQREQQLNKSLQQTADTITAQHQQLAKKPPAKIGMTTEQVRHHTNWGEPISINRTINKYGKFEQWVYENHQYLYFENGKLVSIHVLE